MVVSFVGPETPTNLEFRPSIVKPESRTLFRPTLPAHLRRSRPARRRIGTAGMTRPYWPLQGLSLHPQLDRPAGRRSYGSYRPPVRRGRLCAQLSSIRGAITAGSASARWTVTRRTLRSMLCPTDAVATASMMRASLGSDRLETGGWPRVEGLYSLHALAFIVSTTADGFRCRMYRSVVATDA